MNGSNSAAEALRWHSPAGAPFQISGFAWWGAERKYRRLPTVETGVIRDILDELADNTSGGQLRFATDATRLVIKAKLFAPNTAEHVTATAVNGFDCYLGKPGAQLYYGTTRFAHDAAEYEYVFFDNLQPEMRYVTLNFPLFQGVRDVQIGMNAEAGIFEFPAYPTQRKVVLYGTSITQGGCASRPGMSFTNILSRRFDMEFINLGFSGNGKGDPEIARMIGDIEDPALIVVDYDANNVHADDLIRTMPEFLRILRGKHAEVPILVISRIPYGYEHTNTASYEDRVVRRDYQSELVASLRRQGDRFIHFHDGADLLGEIWNECTVDGVHPTDLGHMRIADGLTPLLRGILQGD
ncbi:SGNH/GDSL hydrolase family protein [Cohnella rhizosphaerae]|uniref:SGNH/GDSL hydrolase family protein n=1 Tax=Cohnella rhizosphaerae TaxID=1457232 RepID=A0A9X4QRB7_9BACL|nr:SGNH/GDSL hydrolase family protein [Cohnella rhizosphaerae]MDG0808420.1 SGNH/GDSL hydrolase family protein [Cohnella rhizosphaerae]